MSIGTFLDIVHCIRSYVLKAIYLNGGVQMKFQMFKYSASTK